MAAFIREQHILSATDVFGFHLEKSASNNRLREINNISNALGYLPRCTVGNSQYIPGASIVVGIARAIFVLSQFSTILSGRADPKEKNSTEYTTYLLAHLARGIVEIATTGTPILIVIDIVVTAARCFSLDSAKKKTVAMSATAV